MRGVDSTRQIFSGNYQIETFAYPILSSTNVVDLKSIVESRVGNGRGGGARTPDKWIKSPLLYQLSYTPNESENYKSPPFMINDKKLFIEKVPSIF